ncbi:MAG: thiolase family protein [Deltaproteobacteria bacterium]|nr:thiolase family protein [Deltaproteobacteria bacterium]
MKETVFVSAVRTPIGRYMGSLKTVRIQDLAAHTMKAAIDRAGIDSGALDMSIYSQSMQSSLPANVGRHAWTLAGLSEDPAGYTLNTLCAGALQTMISGFNKIVGEEYQGMLVGGVESYSLAHCYLFHPRYEFGPHSLCFNDSKLELETNAQPDEQYGELTAATLADMIAGRYGFARSVLDAYTLCEQEKALVAIASGRIAAQIEPVTIKQRKKEIVVDVDELPEDVAMEELMALEADNDGGTATDANVAPWADGAASLVMLSAERAQELGAKPLARMLGFGIAAGNPTLPELTAVRSMENALDMCGLRIDEVNFFDIHTPSAAYGITIEDMLGEAAVGKVNVDGSALAFGHPGAATGAILATGMIHRLAGDKGSRGLINVGALGGQALSIIVEGY